MDLSSTLGFSTHTHKQRERARARERERERKREKAEDHGPVLDVRVFHKQNERL
jgi:hypothetical protein